MSLAVASLTCFPVPDLDVEQWLTDHVQAEHPTGSLCSIGCLWSDRCLIAEVYFGGVSALRFFFPDNFSNTFPLISAPDSAEVAKVHCQGL